jgi:opacity protein-like surface antigen
MKTPLLLSACAIAAMTFATGANADMWDGAYVSVLGGPTIGSPHVTLGNGVGYPNNGFNAGGRIGYKLDTYVPWSGFAVEGDIFYNRSNFDGSRARESSLSGMGNLVYHIDTGFPVGAYVGAGVGAVSTQIRGNGLNGDESTTLGWQGIGGVDYQFSPETAIFAEYRYLNAHDANLVLPDGSFGRVSNLSQNVSVGLKFNL